jgi:dipeptidyl aminopeptidase/acylaminoacyl peptidase
MKSLRLVPAAAVGFLTVLAIAPALTAQQPATVADWLSPAYPYEIQSAHKAERIAFLAYDEGKRNVFTAAAPAFTPVRVTAFLKDDGTDLTDLEISDDGSTVAFVRGHATNRDGWVANPNSSPDGAERAIWAARTAAPGVAWRVVEAATYALAPNGNSIVFAREGQIYRALVTPVKPASARDRGEEPFIRAWGTNGNPSFSPDGRKIAFVSQRVDHSFVVVYDIATRTMKYMAPDVDFDSSPTWSADSKRIAFLRRPGLPFGQQGQQGAGGVGLPNGPAFNPNAAQGRGGQGQGQGQGRGGQGQGRGGGGRGGGRGGAQTQDDQPAAPRANLPGLLRATFAGGYTLSLMVADVATGEAKEIWHTTPEEQRYTGINSIRWLGGDAFLFTMNVQGREGARYYSIVPSTGVTSQPVLLTTTEGIIEDATSASIGKDGRTLFYTTNDGDIDRRHIWAVPTNGSSPPKQVSPGNGIETFPMPLASGQRFAAFSATDRRPQSVGVFQLATGEQRVIYPKLPARFPIAAHVTPQAVTLKAADGIEFYNQLFVPKDIKPGDKRPAMIFVHGGPQRQMLLGYHYRYVYHMFYGINQWLASQGYIVMSVNYRSGVGYGSDFRNAQGRGGQGNSEYGDVLAAGKYLQGRPDVDTRRIGIWGLSYGGVLTAQALARNSDIFAAGVDLAGVHLWGSSLDPEAVSFKSSAISAIGSWKSPVLLFHGDDDRNVAFQQTTGLVQLLRAHKVPYELVVFPDDVHDSLIHARWIYTFKRMDEFLRKYLTGN